MARLKIYTGKAFLLTTDTECTLHLTADKNGMTVVVNTQEETALVQLDLGDLKNLAANVLARVGQHRELLDAMWVTH